MGYIDREALLDLLLQARKANKRAQAKGKEQSWPVLDSIHSMLQKNGLTPAVWEEMQCISLKSNRILHTGRDDDTK